ncbi:Diphosphoinositol polyphosphate phosphohydrolase aps1 [Choanephora cucurbitarum]|uniref:Diphosphoinositol polyphosphate phosphohydrolase aps1 n=1 Tax=Choanephora cucurbitarum TaxID=101091 RepID=A0A1C7N1U5_9FUNG|nr:Diphosphoinositol polyphosphate phosphohydrolase aps1 [Choanephora cucurbitarum]
MLFKKSKKKDTIDHETGITYSMTPRQGHACDVYDENNIRQVAGCLPIDPINKRFLLVTSSSNPNVWVIPKGGWEQGETQQQAAMRETWEEAGVKGKITRHVGVFAEKTKAGVKAHHWIYEMEIREVCKKFPEQKKRERRWFTYDEAMVVVKAHYIHDALAMSSLCPTALSNDDSDEQQTEKKKKKKDKKKKKSSDDEEEEEDSEKKQKKKEKKDADSGDEGVEEGEKKKKKKKEKKAAEDSEEESEEDKKKKKKDKKKKGEIIEMTEEELAQMPPLPSMNTTPLGKVDPSPPAQFSPVSEQVNNPLSQQLGQMNISAQANQRPPAVVNSQPYVPHHPPPSQYQARPPYQPYPQPQMYHHPPHHQPSPQHYPHARPQPPHPMQPQYQTQMMYHQPYQGR